MSSIHTVREGVNRKNRVKKDRLLEKIGGYDIFRENGSLKVTFGARIVGFRGDQADAHTLIRSDIQREAAIAAKTVTQKAA